MNTLREAAQKALEAMQTNAYAVANEAPHRDVMAYYEAIAALAEALTEDALQRLTDANQEIEAVLKQEPCNIAPDGVCETLDCCKERNA
jgi:aspartyl/asparaginyl-tRNA synthetase